jgi:hypothetical protein
VSALAWWNKVEGRDKGEEVEGVYIPLANYNLLATIYKKRGGGGLVTF